MRSLAILLTGLLLLAPTAPAQSSLLATLADVHFAVITFTVGPNRIDVVGADMEIKGGNAAQLRGCIDGSDCPDSTVASLSNGDRDGTATNEEAADFAQALKDVIGLNAEARAFRTQIKQIVTIDDQAPGIIDFDSFSFRNVEGPVSSESPILFTVRLFGQFDALPASDSHRIKIQRTHSALDVADVISVAPTNGWTINGDTIQPLDMRRLFQENRLHGSQGDFESDEPLIFSIEKKSSTGVIIGLSAVGLAAALGAFLLAARRRRTTRKP